MVNNDIKSQNLEAHLIFDVLRLATFDEVLDVGYDHAHGLDHDIINLQLDFPDFLGAIIQIDSVKDTLKRSLASNVVIYFISVLHEIL